MKKIGLFLATLGLIMFGLPKVQALNIIDGNINYARGVDGEIYLTLAGDATNTITVDSDEKVILDLGEYTLTNESGLDTIYVSKGGSIEIKGNSGKIINTTPGKAPVFNNGETTINGGNISRDTTGGNNYYVIVNHGNMTINKANVSVNGTGSSLVENGYYSYNDSTNERLGYVENVNEEHPFLIINDGTFDGGMNTIKNDDNAKLEINGGVFKNNYQVSLMNWNEAIINGGVFETPTGNDKTNIFVGNAGANSVDKGKLTINNGVFNAEYIIEGSLVTPVTINNGEFNFTTSFLNTNPANSNSTLTSVGVKVKGGKFAKEDENIGLAQGYSKYLINNEVIVAKTLNFKTSNEDITLALKETKTIDLEDLVLKYGTFENSNEEIVSLNKNKITAIKEGTAKITITFNNEVKTINVKVVANNENKDSAKKTKNPKTADKIITTLIITALSFGGLDLLIGIKKKRLI